MEDRYNFEGREREREKLDKRMRLIQWIIILFKVNKKERQDPCHIRDKKQKTKYNDVQRIDEGH